MDVKKLRAKQKAKLQQRMQTSVRRSEWRPEGGGGSGSDRYPQAASNTVIVKLRTTATATRRVFAALRASEGVGAPVRQPFLATLVENGYAERITPVFPTPIVQPAARGTLRALSVALRDEQPVSAARGLMSIKVDPRASANQLAAHLNSLGDEIEYAYVPPVKYPFVSTKKATKKAASKRPRPTNDPLGARQWGHGAIKVREARAKASFKDATQVIVAVLDSGIDRTHPDLDGSIHSYVNFLSNEDDRDYQGHGTHVAGIIAAEINNQVGVAGICAARIMALKALPRRGNPWNAEAYYRALAHPITAGAKVINLSLGGGLDPGERDIVTDLIDAGVTVVAAMGNEYEEGNPTSYPAAYDGVIAVGATDEVDRRASFSCTGPHISLVAPGVNILSTTPQYPSEVAGEVLYDSLPGTSMATPHVAAAVALLLAKKPNLKPVEIRDHLRKTADRVRWQSSRPDEEYGYGRLNLEAALK
jgi:subtilisin family serine protease